MQKSEQFLYTKQSACSVRKSNRYGLRCALLLILNIWIFFRGRTRKVTLKLNLQRSNLWYLKAYRLVADGHVRLLLENINREYYDVASKDTYSVIYDKVRQLYLCSCMGKSYWFVNQEHCSHTKAVQINRIIRKRIKNGI